MSNDFKEKVIISIEWSTLGNLTSQIINYALLILLARLLAPSDFGLLAMITIIIGFGQIIQDFGISSAIVQAKHISQKYLSTAFWINFVLGLLIFLLMVLIAHPVAKFYKEPILSLLILYLSVQFFINTFALVQNALLERELNFKTLFIVDFSSVIISGAISLYLALYGYGVWSLVSKVLSYTICRTIFLLFAKQWLPSTYFNKKQAKEILNFCVPLLGSRSIFYFSNNIDNVLVGKYLGDESLGIYSRAFSLVLFPIQSIAQIFGRVLLSSFSQIQDTPARIKAIYLKITQLIALLTFPLMFGVLVMADVFIWCLLGEKWMDVVPIIRILSMVSVVKSISMLNGNIYTALGKNKLQFKLILLTRIFLISIIILGLFYGLLGIALGYLLGSVVIAFINLYFMGSLIELSLIRNISNVASIFIASLIMAVIVFLFDYYLNSSTSCGEWCRLLLGSSIGVVTYVSLVFLFKVESFELVVSEIQKRYLK